MKKPYNTTNPDNLTEDQKLAMRKRVANKTGVPLDKVIGPFGPNELPVNGSGMYIRISLKTGQPNWAYRGNSHWGLHATKLVRAEQLKTRNSRKACMWLGYTG